MNNASQLRQKMDRLLLYTYLYLSCVGAKNIAQSLLKDISQCYKEALLSNHC